MSDIGFPQFKQDVVASITPVSGSGNRGSVSVSSGQSLPQGISAEPTETDFPVTESGVNQAIAELNSYVQNEQRDLMFSLDEGTGDMIVRVIDRSSGDLIRQIPHEVVLDLAAKARENEPLQLISMQG
ncbi:flagellar protein FlaG [Aestuariicella sp. G3-2]|uniref:flagellar protein FlaG n=1 Tax=Pseudomaricurvus albidus TaxID=2842452 RepID=UPI001C0B1873|nr:flagellar protein FlaG [Aestuariicella albida]MBU3071162.1 flagellar protein FlaG [Aestuariicella albida]